MGFDSKFNPSKNYVNGDLTVDGDVYITGSLSASAIVGGGATTPGLPATSVQYNDGGAFAGDADFTWDKTTNTLTVNGDITSSANVSGAFFYGDGSGLTGITATASPAGSDTEIQFNDAGSLGADPQFTWDKTGNTLTVTGDISASVNISGSAFYGDGSNLTNLPSAAITTYDNPNSTSLITSVNATTVQGETNLTFDGTVLTVTGNISASVNISGSDFYGGGANLTDLNASNVSAGTLDNTRLPATISVTNVTASSLVSASFFYGDGSNLTNLPADPPAGSNTQIQYNADGAFGSDSALVWASGSDTLSVTGVVSASMIAISGTSLDQTPFRVSTPNSPSFFNIDASASSDGASRIIIRQDPDPADDPQGTFNERGVLHIENSSAATSQTLARGITMYSYSPAAFASVLQLHTWNTNNETTRASKIDLLSQQGAFPSGGEVPVDMILGQFQWGGDDGNGPRFGVKIQAKATEDWSFASKNGTDLQFFLVPTGKGYNTNYKERIRMTNEGHLVIFPYSASNNDADALEDNYDKSAGAPAIQVYGSTLFGSSSASTHTFTGSVNVNGDISASLNVSASAFYGDGSNLTNLPAGSPAGSDTEIQFNDGGTAFGADPQFTWNKTSNTLTVTGDISASVNISGSSFYGDGSNLTNLPSAAISTYDNPNATSLITSVNATTVQGEANLTFDGTTLSITGDVSGSGNISGSAFYGDGSNLTNLPAGSPAGSNTQVQYNADGALGADNAFVWASGSNTLTVSGTVEVNELQFDTDHVATGHTTGRLYWDDDAKTITADMQGSDVRLQIGQEEHVYVQNVSGVTINNGDAVRISGASGTNIQVEKAISEIRSFTDPVERDSILGLATEEILNNQFGYITTFGAVRDLNTSTFSTGDILYLSHTTSGSYTNIRPPAPYFPARIGIVEVVNATEGVVLSRPEEPTFLTDIAGVTGSGVPVGTKSYLCYDDTTQILSFTDGLSGSFSGSFQGDGSSLISLDASNISAGTLDNARLPATISVTNVTASTEISASLLYGDGSNLTGLARDFGPSAADPAGSPSAGDFYYNTLLNMTMHYDSSRSKWLSAETAEITFGRNGQTGGGAFYRSLDGKSYSATNGRYAEHSGTVVSISYTRDDTDAAIFNVTSDGTTFSFLSSSALVGNSSTLDDDFSANTVIGVKNQAADGNATTGVLGVVRIKWRI